MNSKQSALQAVNTRVMASSSVTTQIEDIKYRHNWIINNFSARREEPGENFKSPVFPVLATTYETSWYLEVYPKGCCEEESDYLGICLFQNSGNISNNKAKYKISVLNSKHEEIESKVAELSLSTKPWGFDKFMLNSILSEMEDDKIIIFCEISTLQDRVWQFDDFIIPECTLSTDYGNLFEKQMDCDFTLSVGDQEFGVHKAILASRSSVFEAMFNSGMRENELNKATITDFDYEVIREMLRYIYTGKTCNLESMAVELLDAANKYALDRLKNLSAEVLYKTLSVENAAETFILADMHNADQLKNKTKHFITIHAKDVSKTSNWKALSQTHPLLLREAFSALANIPTPFVVEPPTKRIRYFQ